VLEAADAPADFHATIHARRKRYRYVIDKAPNAMCSGVITRGTSSPLDEDAMHRASASACAGPTTSAASRPPDPSGRRAFEPIHDVLVRRGEGADARLITLEIEANGFLYNMVRAIVGSLVRVGRGARPVAWMAEVLAGRRPPRRWTHGPAARAFSRECRL